MKRTNPTTRTTTAMSLLLALSGTALAAEPWINVAPANAPGCSTGTPYSFWVRPGDPQKLVVNLAGGGACWSGETCAVHGDPVHTPYAGLDENPSNRTGMYEASNPENPVADYTMIHLVTCNGDVYLGDSDVTYDAPAMEGHPAQEVEVKHRGFPNAMAALNWVFETYPEPENVAVTGLSAGAIPSPIYAHIVAQNYPDAQISHFADGAGSYRVGEKLDPLFETWGTKNVLKQIEGFEDLGDNGLSFEDFYVRAAQLNPDMTFHQYNSRHDEVQGMFMMLLGVEEPDVPGNLDKAHAYIREHVPNFRTYTNWGHAENIIGGYYDGILAEHSLDNRGHPYVLDRLYTYQSNGVRFLDWFAAAVTSQPVEDVACVDCETPDYYGELEETFN